MIRPVLAVLVLLFVVLCGFQLFGNVVYGCQLKQTSIDFVLFRLVTVWRLPYEDIADVRQISFIEMFSLGHLPLGFSGKPFGKFVALTRKSGILKLIVVTPDRRDNFIATVRQRLTP